MLQRSGWFLIGLLALSAPVVAQKNTQQDAAPHYRSSHPSHSSGMHTRHAAPLPVPRTAAAGAKSQSQSLAQLERETAALESRTARPVHAAPVSTAGRLPQDKRNPPINFSSKPVKGNARAVPQHKAQPHISRGRGGRAGKSY